MSTVAKGNAVALGLGIERRFGVPAPSLVSLDPILPLGDGLKGAESPDATVNRTAFMKPGLPGPKSGEIPLTLPLIPGHLLEVFAHLLGSVEKDEPVPGVFVYTFRPVLVPQHVNSFWAYYGREPVERELQYGIKFGTLAGTIGDNVQIPLALTGLLSHGCQLGLAVPDPGNVGAFTQGPYLRGVLENPDLGDVYLQVTDVPAGGGLKFKVHQTDAVPTFPGADVPLSYGVDDEARWQPLYDHDGRSLGILDATNKDLIEVVFPGTAADHGLLAVGDVFHFPRAGTWSTPSMTVLPRAGQMTSKNWVVRARKIGESDYREVDANTGSFAFENPIEFDRGNGSRYAFDIIRPGQISPTVQIAQSLVDTFLAELFNRHRRLDLQIAFLGAQLGADLTHREGLEITMPSAGINELARPVSAPTKVIQTANFLGETNDAGDDPVQVVITTDRDWTPVS